MNRYIIIARKIVLVAGIMAAMGLLNGCGLKNLAVDRAAPVFTDSGDRAAQPRAKTKPSKPYTVLGETYYPISSAEGYEEVGVASWYGKDFHGKKTANGETYNMYALTAAHKTLPLGARMKVTNLENGKSVVVDINDRGPFVGSRVIDLSYAAARAIGMHEKGLAKVRISTILDVPAPETYVASAAPVPRISTPRPALAEVSHPNLNLKVSTLEADTGFYIQVGAFSRKQNAREAFSRLVRNGFEAEVRTVNSKNGQPLYHVRAGEFARKSAARKALAKIRRVYPSSYIIASN